MKKGYYHKCERCGCSLDPGEGRICDECLLDENKNPAESGNLPQDKPDQSSHD